MANGTAFSENSQVISNFQTLLPGISVQLELPLGTFGYTAHVLEIKQIRDCSVDWKALSVWMRAKSFMILFLRFLLSFSFDRKDCKYSR